MLDGFIIIVSEPLMTAPIYRRRPRSRSLTQITEKKKGTGEKRDADEIKMRNETGIPACAVIKNRDL